MHPWVSIAITCCQRGCQETRTASPPYREWFGTCACRNNQTTLRFIMEKNLRTNTNIIWTNIHHMFLHHMCVSYHVSISLHSCFLPELLTTCLEVPKYRWMLGDIGSSCRLTTKSIENYRPNILKTHHWRFVPQTFILLEIYHAKCSTS